jgi:DNA-binding CsgD family transcriptional regulator
MVDPGTGRREFRERSEASSGGERRDGQEFLPGRQPAQQAQRLEYLGKLADGLAHDFNNLLAVILSYASFVSAELAVPSGPDWPNRLESVRSDLGQITLAAERAASLTRQLLASVHQEVVPPRALDLDHGVTDVQEMLRRTRGEYVGLVAALADDLRPAPAGPDLQALLGAIMAGTGSPVPKQARGPGLVSAVRTRAPDPSVPGPDLSRQVTARLRDRMRGEDPLAALTGQEKRVLELIGEGLTNRQIAERMFLAEKTAKNYVSSLLAKLGMHRRAEAAAFAARHPPDHGE